MANLKGLRRLFGRSEKEARVIDSRANFIKNREAQQTNRMVNEYKNPVHRSPMSSGEAAAARDYNMQLRDGRIRDPWEAGNFKTRSIEGKGGGRTRTPRDQRRTALDGPRQSIRTGDSSWIGPQGTYGPHEAVHPQGPYGPHEAPKTGGGSANSGTNPTAAAVEKTYSDAESDAIAKEFNGKWNNKDTGLWGRAGMVGKGFVGTTKASLEAEGHSATLGGFAMATGKNMMVGAVAGGAVGGVTSAAQGGDFWDGAKEGAFNGAVAWGGAHAIRRGIGAKTLVGKDGVYNTAKNMGGAFAKDGVASSAKTLINARQMAGMSAAVTKGAVK